MSKITAKNLSLKDLDISDEKAVSWRSPSNDVQKLSILNGKGNTERMVYSLEINAVFPLDSFTLIVLLIIIIAWSI